MQPGPWLGLQAGALPGLPPMLPCSGKQFIRYIWLSQNHMQHQFYKITSTSPLLLPLAAKQQQKKHQLQRDSLGLSHSGRPPTGRAFLVAPPPRLFFLGAHNCYSAWKTDVPEELASRCACVFAFNANKYSPTSKRLFLPLWII